MIFLPLLFLIGSFATSARALDAELVRAIESDQIDVIQSKIGTDILPTSKLKGKESVLDRAITAGAEKVFDAFIQYSKNLEAKESNQKLTDSRGTPILISLASLAVPGKSSTAKYERMLERVLSLFPDRVNSKDKAFIGDGRTALHNAAAVGNLSVVKMLVSNGAEVNLQNSSGETALHLASKFGHLEVVKFLIDSGAPVNNQTKFTRSTPIVYAAEMGHEQIIRHLLKNGANPEKRDTFGKTAPDRYHEFISSVHQGKLQKRSAR